MGRQEAENSRGGRRKEEMEIIKYSTGGKGGVEEEKHEVTFHPFVLFAVFMVSLGRVIL